MSGDYRNLHAWKKAFELALAIYAENFNPVLSQNHYADSFPAGIRSIMRRIFQVRCGWLNVLLWL